MFSLEKADNKSPADHLDKMSADEKSTKRTSDDIPSLALNSSKRAKMGPTEETSSETTLQKENLLNDLSCDPDSPGSMEDYHAVMVKDALLNNEKEAENLPSQILDFLTIGDSDNAHDLEQTRECGFTHIINCAPDYVTTGSAFYNSTKVRKYIEFCADDDEDYDMTRHIPEVFDVIKDAQENEGKVLIHGKFGVNRSGFLAAAYYMEHEKVGPITATRSLRSRRKRHLSNEKFIMQLVEYAKTKLLLTLDQDKLNEEKTDEESCHETMILDAKCYNEDEATIRPSKILDFLYIGRYINAEDFRAIRHYGFTHIIDCMAMCVKPGLEYYKSTNVTKYIQFPIQQYEDDYDVMQHFPEAFDFIEDARKCQGKVLIHCLGGVNESGVLASAYYMTHQKVGPITATRFVRSIRRLHLTKKAYMMQLIQYAKREDLLKLDKDKKFEKKSSALHLTQTDEEIAFSEFMQDDAKYHNKKPFPDPPTKVFDFLYIGRYCNIDDLEEFKQYGFTHIINCAAYNIQSGFEYYQSTSVVKYIEFWADDDDSYDMMQHIPEAFEFIEDARKNDGKVLIHCLNGDNRSGVLASAYYMMHEKVGPITAARFVRKERHFHLKNKNFIRQLVHHANVVGLLELDRDKLSEKREVPKEEKEEESSDEYE